MERTMSQTALDRLKSKLEKFRADRPHSKTPFPDDIIHDVKSLLKTYKPGRLRRVAKVPVSLLDSKKIKKRKVAEVPMNIVRLAPLVMNPATSLSLEISFSSGLSARVVGSPTAQDIIDRCITKVQSPSITGYVEQSLLQGSSVL
jgi:hypothetical protein